MEIPYQKLKSETLDNIIKEFVYREGTDYGSVEYTLDTKIKQVRKQLQSGKIVILYDKESESTNIVTKEQLKRFQDASPEH